MGKLKDLFFVAEETTGTEQNVVAESKINKGVFTQPVHESPAQSIEQKTVVEASADEDMVSQIWQQIINRNLPGPDYLELRNNASALEGLPLSEEQRLEAAFKVLKKTYPNLTKEVILKSIDTYIGVVNEEKASGIEQCKKLRASTIGEKESRLKVMRETNEETLRQINELKKRYDETTANINSMEHEILTASQELDAKEKAFIASVESAMSVLVTDKSKIATLNF